MKRAISLNDLKLTQPAVTICSQTSMDAQSPTPVPSPNNHHYAPLPPNSPDERTLSSKHDHVSSPAEVRKFANPAPLGCCAFALTSFVSNCMNLYMINKTAPSIEIGLALTYGGIVQLLAGMWYVGPWFSPCVVFFRVSGTGE